MQVALASQAAPNRAENEDAALHLGQLVGVFDGVTKPRDTDTGCSHSPAWYVQRLTARLRDVFRVQPTATLPDGLAEAITHVRADHGGQCDLGNPATPAAAVCLVRGSSERLEYLILSDCTLVVDEGVQVTALTDERFARTIAQLRTKARAEGLATPPALGHTPGKWDLVNRPEGYWIAGANPEAAHKAVLGDFPLTGSGRIRRAALLTDGASCAVDLYEIMDWRKLLDTLSSEGPEQLIRRVRQIENEDRGGEKFPRFKRHDDSTAALCLFEE